MAAPNYRTSTTALVDALKGLFENRTCTEAQAIANASSKPNTIYYTTDTKCVVVGGQIYGRGQQLSSVFRFCPSGSVPGQDPDFSDPDYIYIVPDGTSFTLYWLNPGGAWSHTTGFQFDIATSAEDISYDLTQTPDLGTGDVQSAIEALDGKVKAVDARIDDEKVEFIKNVFPTKLDTDYTRVNRTSARFDNGNLVAVSAGSTFYVTYTAEKVPKGSLIHLVAKHSQGSYYSYIGYATSSPVDWYAEHSTMVGFELTGQLYWKSANSHDVYVILPEEGWLVFGWVSAYSYSYTRTIYSSDVIKDYYKKGVADGSGMASIVGLGYNIFDYITGAVNMEGFEYGVEFFKAHPTLSGRSDTDTTLLSLQNNTSMVYFPKCTMTGVTHVDRLFYEDTNLVCVPPLHFGGITNTGANMFNSCTKLEVVPPITGFVVGTSYLYMFRNTTLLSRIESLDVSGMTETGRSAGNNNNIFRSTTGTNNGLAVKRYILFKGIGTQSANTHWYFHSVTNWGVADSANPDARQSVIDTLLTYSFDRATAGFANCTVHLAANTFNQLTTEEKEQITAKGYVLTTS